MGFPTAYLRDPADRIIGATALVEGLSLITADREIPSLQKSFTRSGETLRQGIAAKVVCSMVTSKPANGGQGKSGQRTRPEIQICSKPFSHVQASLFLCTS